MRLIRPGLHVLVSIFALLSAAPAGAADFPDPAELPSRPELPDPLVMFDGQPVTSPEQWTTRRRPELKRLFMWYMYGGMPERPASEAFALDREDTGFLGGKATLREVTINLGRTGAPPINLLLVVPNRRTGPLPAFLGLNFMGNQTVVDDPKVALPTVWVPGRGPGVKDNRATNAGRGTQGDVWAVD
jgi:hypothetical protein